MKALLVGLIFTLLYSGIITAIFRRFHIEERAAAMVLVFSCTLPFYTLVYLWTPADLGPIPASLAVWDRGADLIFGFIVYFAGFFGGVLQIYNLADRGFSLRLLMDLAQRSDLDADPARIADAYSDGKGIQWMYRKRIDDLQKRRLIALDGENVVLTDRGRSLARTFLRMRTFLKAA